MFKVAVTGPESTGKSSISSQLAQHYQTLFVPEYARIYLDNLGREYVESDLLEIAKKQVQMEDEYEQKANKILFCDTELTVIKIWSGYAYQKCDRWILDQKNVRKYDLYLLMDVDLPWEYDKYREHQHLRTYFYELYKHELINTGSVFYEISGVGEERLNRAVHLIDTHLKAISNR